MPNDDTTPIGQVAPAIDTAKNSADAFQESLSGMGDRVSSLTSGLKGMFDNTSAALSGLGTGVSGFLKDLSSGVPKVSDVFSALSKSVAGFSQDIQDGEEKAVGFALQTGSAIATYVLPQLTNASGMFGTLGTSGANAGNQISTAFASISPFLTALPKGMADGIGNLAASADTVSRLQTTFIHTAAAAGEMNAMFKTNAGLQSVLTDSTAAFAIRMQEVGDRTGLVSTKVAEYYQQLAQIRGASNAFIEAGAVGTMQMDVLSASIKVANTYGLDYTQMIDKMKEAQINFGTSADVSVANMARMAGTAQDVGLHMSVMQKYISEANFGMENMADNTDSAISVMRGLGAVMRENGVSEAGTAGILGTLTSTAKNMDYGKESFISQQSGGRGGLAGAFDIEALRRTEGGTGQVVEKMLQAMEKQFGQIVTLGDRQENSALDGILLKEVEMLKSFGLAKDNNQAYDLLEAMKSGATDTLAKELETPSKTKEEALKDAIDKSAEIQNTGLNEMVQLTNQILITQQLIAANSFALNQGMFGDDYKDKGTSKHAIGVTDDPRMSQMSMTQASVEKLEAALKFVKEVPDKITEGLLGGRAVIKKEDGEAAATAAAASPRLSLAPATAQAVTASAAASGPAQAAERGRTEPVMIDGRFEMVLKDEHMRTIAEQTVTKRFEASDRGSFNGQDME